MLGLDDTRIIAAVPSAGCSPADGEQLAF